MAQKPKKLVEFYIRCDLQYWYYGSEEGEKIADIWIEKFHEFLRDHRSQDNVLLQVVKIYEDAD